MASRAGISCDPLTGFPLVGAAGLKLAGNVCLYIVMLYAHIVMLYTHIVMLYTHIVEPSASKNKFVLFILQGESSQE